MADHAQLRAQCPNCGESDIRTDRFYGNKLKREDFFRQLARNPVFWVGVILELVDLFVLPNLTTTYTGGGFLRFGLAGWVGWILILIAIVPAYRASYGDKDVSRYPEVGYTYRACGHQWISENP